MLKINVIREHNNEVEFYFGAVGLQVGNGAIDMAFVDGTRVLVPFSGVKAIERTPLTDEEILNGPDKKLAEWYQAQLDAQLLEAEAANEQPA